MNDLTEYACRDCHGRLRRLEEPWYLTNDTYIGPNDKISQEIVQHGRYEGTTQARYTHRYEYLCLNCNCVKTIDQVEPWQPQEALPSACQTAPSRESGLSTPNA